MFQQNKSTLFLELHLLVVANNIRTSTKESNIVKGVAFFVFTMLRF